MAATRITHIRISTKYASANVISVSSKNVYTLENYGEFPVLKFFMVSFFSHSRIIDQPLKAFLTRPETMMVRTVAQFFRTVINNITINLGFVFMKNLSKCPNNHYLR